jgi:hypothetical protein
LFFSRSFSINFPPLSPELHPHLFLSGSNKDWDNFLLKKKKKVVGPQRTGKFRQKSDPVTIGIIPNPFELSKVAFFPSFFLIFYIYKQ